MKSRLRWRKREGKKDRKRIKVNVGGQQPHVLRSAHPMRFVAEQCSRRHVVACLAAAAASTRSLPAFALPEECTNGVMELRQAQGVNPFDPPCDGPDPWKRAVPPVYPVFVAKRAVDNLLDNEEVFRNTVRVGAPTGTLQLPPEINPTLLEQIADFFESKGTMSNAEEFRAAAKSYVRAAYDANELIAFAYSKEVRPTDAQVCEYVDGSLAACRRCRAALATIVSLLPAEAIEVQVDPSNLRKNL